MIRIEIVKMLLRRRTWAIIAALNALPLVVAILLSTTDIAPRPGTGPPFLAAVLSDGLLYPLAAMGIVLPLFLPIAVAVVGGDAIAGEATGGTLRYVLVRPVARGRLLIAKLNTVVVFVLLAVVSVAVAGLIEGQLLLGTADPSAATVSISGTSLSTTQLFERSLLAVVYVTLSMLSVAAVALLLSTLTDSSVGAAMGTLGFLIGSTVLLGLDAADPIRDFLPTRFWLSFVDLFRDPVRWTEVLHGLESQLAYLLVFLAAAWANFATKDVNS